PATPADALLEIESALAATEQKRAALIRARDGASSPSDPKSAASNGGEDAGPSTALELANRLVRVLEQRREAQRATRDLEGGREAIRAVLAREPRELIGDPPPFPVPTLDGVRRAWIRESEQEASQKKVVEDRRANVLLAAEAVKTLEQQRRRLRDALDRERRGDVRVEREPELRRVEDELEIARQEEALARQLVANATLELEIKQMASRQTRAALAWVEDHVAPREADLASVLDHLDRERLEIERELDLARAREVAAEGSLQAAEERHDVETHARADGGDAALASRRTQLGHRQHAVALLSERIERIARMRKVWQQRYAVLGGDLDLTEAPAWLAASKAELERLTRLRRIEESEQAERRLALATALREHEARGLDDLEDLVVVYQADLGSLDRAIELEEQLRVELAARLDRRDLRERFAGALVRLRAFWSHELTSSADHPITPGKLVIALAVILLGAAGARFATRFAAKRLFPRFGLDAGASNAFASLFRYALLAAVFLVALRVVNIPLTAFAVVGGALAVGIGFGSQAVMSNFISGLLLLAERPIKIGDLIEVDGTFGIVEAIGLRSTRIRNADNFHIIVPNSTLLEGKVVNWTHQDPLIRFHIAVGVAYGSQTRDVERLLLEIAAGNPYLLREPEPIVFFRDFGDSALIFELRVWYEFNLKNDRIEIESDLRHRIVEVFAEHGIEIAYPQMDVHLDVVSGSGAGIRGILPGT
ncbi:mechanosensitive ion channel, partial [Myxococcota bacterium]|nr:mechanosensitive ion channel [Myxococcota bacterium]